MGGGTLDSWSLEVVGAERVRGVRKRGGAGVVAGGSRHDGAVWASEASHDTESSSNDESDTKLPRPTSASDNVVPTAFERMGSEESVAATEPKRHNAGIVRGIRRGGVRRWWIQSRREARRKSGGEGGEADGKKVEKMGTSGRQWAMAKARNSLGAHPHAPPCFQHPVSEGGADVDAGEDASTPPPPPNQLPSFAPNPNLPPPAPSPSLFRSKVINPSLNSCPIHRESAQHDGSRLEGCSRGVERNENEAGREDGYEEAGWRGH
ncbi:hypothetical protein R3P38DRAFT_2776757 [Favolaschia claudopus]|uniref:Uncharacterized protein n=1 Tax=Favolaschia claudopus TaxID=2862362 RepID=A0AAW0BMX1_9AGAR